jgi:hypothetical protein
MNATHCLSVSFFMLVQAQIAMPHFAANQAVTAEGLYRSALEKLEGAFAIQDERYVTSLCVYVHLNV